MRRACVWLALALTAAGCGETGTSGRERGVETESAAPPPRVAEAGPDTASPAAYVIFESKVETERPKRLTLRVLVFSPQSAAGVSKALRLAFDSLAAADSQIVAARAVVYATRMRGDREADLVPVAWAVWAPPEGWSAAGLASRRTIHRTHVYFGTPPGPEIFGGTVEP